MSGGVAAALDEALKAEGDMAAVVQSGLFDDLNDTETGAVDVPTPFSRSLSGKKATRGRPKGAKGRRTEEVTAWLLQQHRHPLSVMMEAYSMSPADFARSVGIQTVNDDVIMEIVKLQLRMAEACTPFVAQKLPQAVQVEGGAALTLNFGGVTLNGPHSGVSSPARAGSPEISVGGGMAVRLGQVGREKSDGDLED